MANHAIYRNKTKEKEKSKSNQIIKEVHSISPRQRANDTRCGDGVVIQHTCSRP